MKQASYADDLEKVECYTRDQKKLQKCHLYPILRHRYKDLMSCNITNGWSIIFWDLILLLPFLRYPLLMSHLDVQISTRKKL